MTRAAARHALKLRRRALGFLRCLEQAELMDRLDGLPARTYRRMVTETVAARRRLILDYLAARAGRPDAKSPAGARLDSGEG